VNSSNPSSNSRPLALPIAAPDLVAVIVMALFAFAEGVALTQSDGDLFAHIRLGQISLAQGNIPSGSVLGFSFTAGAVYPAWLAAVWFAALYRWGGLALIVATTAIVAGVAHGAAAVLFRRHGVEFRSSLVASLLGLALASSHWLARPHEFTLLFSALLLLLLETSEKWVVPACGLLFLFWANLHGGWAFGLVILGCYAAGDVLEWWGSGDRDFWRSRLQRDLLALGFAAIATFGTPYGARLHRAVLSTLSDRSVATLINEYQPPGLSALPDILFFIVLTLSVLAMVATRRRPSSPRLLALLATTAFALRAGRNIALFGLVGWPLIALHVLKRATPADAEAKRAGTGLQRVGIVAIPFALFLLVLGALHGSVGGRELIANSVESDRFPVVAVNRLREAGNSDRTLTTWVWSGYVPYAWPGKRVYFDPLLFSPAILDRFGQMLLTRAGWREQLASSAISVVVLPRGVPLADSLTTDIDWTQWHRDGTATVFFRRNRRVAEQ
jgi:hypothetical protein